jgi:SAM-dependent methyltransferase
MKQIEIPTVKQELRKLILDGLKRAYTSSGKDGIETGNHYQSVTLGDEHTDGFRSDRAAFLDQIDFRGKRVLDLGANLGELSRAARSRGAALVDGYEYDPFFVELAQLLNAYNGTTGVSFYERDITDPGSYREHYDIVLGFSVFTYIGGILARLAEMTDEALVIETHKLDGNLENSYLGPVGKFLPVYEVLGESDWGRSLPEHQTRAVIVFARHRAALDRSLGRRSSARHRVARLDVQRTGLQELFFEQWGVPRGERLLTEVRAMDLDLERVADVPDLVNTPYSGQTYWLIFLKGYCQFQDAGALGPGNIYYDYITKYYAARDHDPGLCEAFKDRLFAMQRVAARFGDVDRFRHSPHAYVPEPVTVFQGTDPADDHLTVYEVGRDEPLRASAVDGWHRLFAARIFGATAISAEVMDARSST